MITENKNHLSRSGFLRVCRTFAGMDCKRTNACLEKLLELEPEYRERKKGEHYCFRPENLFLALREDAAFCRMAGKQKLHDWGDVIRQMDGQKRKAVDYWTARYRKGWEIQMALTTKTGFLRVCREFVKMDKKRADACLKKLIELEPDYEKRKKGKPYYFRPENLFAAIQEDAVFRKMLEKQKYRNWEDVAARMEYWEKDHRDETDARQIRKHQKELKDEDGGLF